MRQHLITILCIYMSYSNIQMLLTVPAAQWQLEQYLLCAVTVGFVLLSILLIIRSLRKWKADKESADNNESEA